MKVLYVKTLWGVTVEMGNAPGGYSRLFAKIKSEGFNAIETPVWMVENPVEFTKAREEAGLDYVAMVNTCTWTPGSGVGVFNLNPSQKLLDHLKSLGEQLELAKALKPLLVNAHSGCDLWPMKTSREYFAEALKIESSLGLMICHETHRGRILYNPWVTRDLCREFPQLKLTADLSHFVCVAERVFSEADEDWAEVMVEVARATKHIHARVGYAQGPQVPDPRAPEYSSALSSHERWWDQILGS